MPTLLEIRSLEADLYQASFDLGLTVVHLFVIVDPRDGVIVIDTSAPTGGGEENSVTQVVRQLGRRPEDVRHVLLTHAHPDHVGNVGEFQRQSGAHVWMNPSGANLLESDPPTLLPGKIRGGGLRTPAAVLPAKVQHRITGTQVIDLAGGIEVINTPGHSSDHQSFLWRRHGGVLFVGDAVANENGQLGFAPFYDDLEEERRSVERLLDYPFEKMAFGHGDYIAQGAKETLLRWRREADRARVNAVDG